MDRLAVYTGTRNIYHDMVVSAKSLLLHNGADRVVFLIEDDAFPEKLPPCVTTMNVSNQTFFSPDGPNYKCRWSYMVMMRMALAYIFPDQHRILTLDHDTIVRKPIDCIWNLDLDGYYFAAVEEKHITIRQHPYFNFGVLLHNLDKLRDGTADEIIHNLNTVRHTFCEQDVGNQYCKRFILELPQEYNVMQTNINDVRNENIAIRHYAARNAILGMYEDYSNTNKLSWADVLEEKNKPRIATRHDVINYFISRRGFRSFLEIGTDTGESLRSVHAETITSVDPEPSTPATHHMTSDDFFDSCHDKFDIIFIDGLHEHNQAYRDIMNALQHLNTGGVIVVHDCLPTSERMQEHHTESQNFEWTGDVWKAFVKARSNLPYELYTIDTDHGCGIIDTTFGKQSDTSELPDNMKTMTYSQFVSHRNEWMNIKKGVVENG